MPVRSQCRAMGGHRGPPLPRAIAALDRMAHSLYNRGTIMYRRTMIDPWRMCIMSKSDNTGLCLGMTFLVLLTGLLPGAARAEEVQATDAFAQNARLGRGVAGDHLHGRDRSGLDGRLDRRQRVGRLASQVEARGHRLVRGSRGSMLRFVVRHDGHPGSACHPDQILRCDSPVRRPD